MIEAEIYLQQLEIEQMEEHLEREKYEMCLQNLMDRLGKKFSTEQLEALVSGEAWVAEWEEVEGELCASSLQRHLIKTKDNRIVFEDFIDSETNSHYMTFNGNINIPTPNEGG